MWVWSKQTRGFPGYGVVGQAPGVSNFGALEAPGHQIAIAHSPFRRKNPDYVGIFGRRGDQAGASFPNPGRGAISRSRFGTASPTWWKCDGTPIRPKGGLRKLGNPRARASGGGGRHRRLSVRNRPTKPTHTPTYIYAVGTSISTRRSAARSLNRENVPAAPLIGQSKRARSNESAGLLIGRPIRKSHRRSVNRTAGISQNQPSRLSPDLRLHQYAGRPGAPD